MTEDDQVCEPANGAGADGSEAGGTQDATSRGVSEQGRSISFVPFSRYLQGMKTGKLRVEAGEQVLSRYAIRTAALTPHVKGTRRRAAWVQDIVVGTPGSKTQRPGDQVYEALEPGEKRAPFRRYIKGVREGMDSVAEPSPSGSRYELSTRTRVTWLLAMMVLVVSGVLFLDYFSPKPPAEDASTLSLGADAKAADTKDKVLGGEPAEPPKPVGPPPPVFVQAYQYIDAADNRSPEARKDKLLESGDYLTLVARGPQRKWLYFMVLGSNDQFRMSRIYSPDLVIRQIPPLKIKIMDSAPGQVQGFVVGSRDELEKLNNWIWEANYKQFEPRELRKTTARQKRLEMVLARLKKEVPAEKWSYKLLPELDYRP